MGSIDDISQLCRLCLVKDQVNIPIFNETSDIEQIFVKINSCLPVKVSRDDNLPKKICDGCSYKLDMLYIFRNTSLDSEKQLIQWLDEAGLNSAPSEQTEVDPLANPLTSTKPEIMVKQETIEPSESRGEGDNSEICMDAQNYIIQQQKLPYEQDFDFGEPSGSSAGLMTDEPAPKRAKRTAAIKKAPLETVEDDLDAAMQITKAEEEDSDEVDQPDYVEPSTSADDQPGPSGVGKPAVEAPCTDITSKMEEADKPYECDLCSSRFKYERSFKCHRKLHENKATYECDVCGRKYNHLQKYTFKIHVNSHKEPKAKCDICNKEFSTKYYYIRHFKEQHDEEYKRPLFSCTSCDRVFNCKSVYNKHILTHDVNHLCDYCGKSLSRQSHLRTHLRIHTGEKPFSCTYCEKRFIRNSELKDHLRVHTKERPMKCEYCQKRFTQKSSLNLHVKTFHTEEKPFSCNICLKKFVSSGLLKSHLNHHSKILE